MTESELQKRFDELQQRLTVLESLEGNRSSRDKLTAALRFLALVPIVGIPLLVTLQILADGTHLPLGVVCLLGWVATVLLWLFTELFTTRQFRFSLARFLLAVTLFAMFFGYGQIYIIAPYMKERNVIESIEGASASTRAHGPELLRRLIGDRYFGTIEQVTIGQPGVDDDIRKLHSLSNLRVVFLKGPGFTNDGLAALSALPDSAKVHFWRTKVTLEAVKNASRLNPKMEFTIQSLTQVTTTLMDGQERERY